MGFFVTRARAVSAYALELALRGLPELSGPVGDELLMVIDGVGGFQFAPLAVRRALRLAGSDLCTAFFPWQTPVPGEIFSDLMWLRRNRMMGAQLARRLRAMRRAHPRARVHLLAFSGGAGIAVFACEHLVHRPTVDTLVLACPALCPHYNLGPALRAVRRAYALVSARDTVILGLGTRIFGTTDRRFTAAAGQTGFRRPPNATESDSAIYQRLAQIHWVPALKANGHHGGHTSWAAVPFLREHLLPILAGTPLLPAQAGWVERPASPAHA